MRSLYLIMKNYTVLAMHHSTLMSNPSTLTLNSKTDYGKLDDLLMEINGHNHRDELVDLIIDQFLDDNDLNADTFTD